MRFGDIVRINEGNTTKKRATRHSIPKLVLAEINRAPGITRQGIVNILPNIAEGSIGGCVSRLAKKNKIKRRMQDGAYRLYPRNYKFSDEVITYTGKVPPIISSQAKSNESIMADKIEQLAKDYAWEHGYNDLTFKKFIAWVREQA